MCRPCPCSLRKFHASGLSLLNSIVLSNLICLIQQATQEFGPCFHREIGPEGMLQATKENAGNSRLHSLLTRACHKEQDGNPREELPIIVDKYVSGMCKCGNSMNNYQTEDVVVAPVKFQSERAIWGKWQKGRAIASVDSTSQFSLPGRNGQLKGKTVFPDQYTTKKRVERGLDDVHYDGEAGKLVMPVEWKEDHNTKFGKSKHEITS